MGYIISFDVGTQSTKAILIDEKGRVLATKAQHYPFTAPKPGWVEQSPKDYWKAVTSTTKALIVEQKIKKEEILAIVFSTQAMGIIPVDQDGQLLHKNISWVDGRAEKEAEQIMKRFGHRHIFKAITGVELSGKDVIPKILWLKNHRPDIYEKTHKILDVNGYLKYRCTGKMVAEWSGACSYGFNLKTKDWERSFFKFSGIDTSKLPDLINSIQCLGKLTQNAATELGLNTDVKVFGGCDDTQSAALGSGQIKEGEAHIYLGSSAWIGVSTSKDYKFKRGVAVLQSADPTSNILVGITESAGVNLEWLLQKYYTQEFHLKQDVYSVMEEEILSIPPGSGGLIFTPWFQGERTPITSTTTRASLLNLGLEHNRGHIVRAQLEGIAFNLKWTMDNMQKDYGLSIKEFTVMGGGAQNDPWMQSLADILETKIHVTADSKNGGAMGCAMIALVGLGIHKDFLAIKNVNPITKTFLPKKENQAVYSNMYAQYKAAYKALKKYYKNANYQTLNS